VLSTEREGHCSEVARGLHRPSHATGAIGHLDHLQHCL